MKCAATGKDRPECRLHTVLLVRFSTQKPCVHLINVLLIKQFFYPKKMYSHRYMHAPIYLILGYSKLTLKLKSSKSSLTFKTLTMEWPRYSAALSEMYNSFPFCVIIIKNPLNACKKKRNTCIYIS